MPQKVLCSFRLASRFKNNFILNWLTSKIDIVFEDEASPFTLTTTQPVIRYFEHPHFREESLRRPQVKKIFLKSKWAQPNYHDPDGKMEILRPSMPITPGLPVIATIINAFPEIVEQGRNGFFIDIKDFNLQSQEYFEFEYAQEYFEYAVKEIEKYLTQLIEDPNKV